MSEEETAPLFVDVYRSVFGGFPDIRRAELLLALLWAENDRGRAIIQHNWGNLSSLGRASETFWRPPWFDVDQVLELPDETRAQQAHKARMLELHAQMVAGRAPSAFFAFPSHREGAEAWLEFIARRPEILQAASSGDPERFARAIAETGYCPDCGNAGATYRGLRDEIRSRRFFAELPKRNGRARSAGLGAAVIIGLFPIALMWATLRVRRRAA